VKKSTQTGGDPSFSIETVWEICEAGRVEEAKQEGQKGQPKYIQINREQLVMTTLDVEELIGADHPARMIWELTGRLELSGFEKEVASLEKQAGRAAWPRRVLISVLAYSYTLGTSSAREMERWMEHEPGLRWLMGLETINHHTLSDFRKQDVERLKAILTEVLALLASEDLVDFETLLQDGTKIQAQAGTRSMHRRKTLSEHLAEAKTCVEELDRRAQQEQASKEEPAKRSRQEAAQQRAARERLARMEASMKELDQREAAAPPSQREQVRVSESEPEARKMKHADGGFAPSYNVQLVTEAKNGFIVGVTVTTSNNDQHELTPGLEMAQSCTQQPVKTMVTDKGYSNRDNIEAMAQRGVTLVAPRLSEEERQAGAMTKAGLDPEYAAGKFRLAEDTQTIQCPAGAQLVRIKVGTHHGQTVHVYQAQVAVCGVCPHKPKCCPNTEARRIERVIESEAVQAHDRRMLDPALQALYKKRKQIAEYPNLRIKSAWRLDRFRLRGLTNVTKEAFWMALAFTLDRLHSVRKRQALTAQLAAA
jgi:transposase